MNNSLIYVIVFLLCFGAAAEGMTAAEEIAAAEESGKPQLTLDGGIYLSSAYLWRGAANCGFHVQPDMALHYKGFTFEAYGYFSLDNTFKEIDLELQYRYKDLDIHLLDCFCYCSGYKNPENYFDWSKETGNHFAELAVCYVPQKYPFYAKWFTFFYGDFLPGENGKKGAPSFSSYLELEAHHTFGRICTGSVIVGSSILKGAYTSYTKDFAVIHCELRAFREIRLQHVSIPLTVSFVVNPYSKLSYLGASAGIRF